MGPIRRANPRLWDRQAQHQDFHVQASVGVVLLLANALLGAAGHSEGYAPTSTDGHRLSVFQQIVYSKADIFGNLP